MTPGSQDVARFRGLVTDRLGLRFDDSALGTLAEVLHHGAAAHGTGCTQYMAHLADPACPIAELHALANHLTVTETYFFRGTDQIRAFGDVALPERLAAAAGMRGVQVLSAGCASGDEPCSLAIAVRETLPHAADQIAITAFDINPAMLEKASRACYSAWSLRDVPTSVQTRWFEPVGNAFVVDPAIHRAVTFQERNLAQDDRDFWRPGRFDIVFCRNVLMYFTIEQARAAVRRIAGALLPGGYLFLGHAETLRGLSNEFHLCHTHGTFYYRRREGDSPSQPTPQPLARWEPAPPISDTSWIDVIQRASNRIDDLARAPAMRRTPHEAATRRSAPDLNLALESLHSERFEQAHALLAALPAEYARDPDVLLLRAVSLSHSGALAAAQAVCRELLACDELNAGAHYVLALCREGAGDASGALEHDQVATYLDPAFAMPRLHLGLLARRRGDRACARHELAQAIALLQREDPARLLLFGGGFQRDALVAVCRAELAACEERS